MFNIFGGKPGTECRQSQQRFFLEIMSLASFLVSSFRLFVGLAPRPTDPSSEDGGVVTLSRLYKECAICLENFSLAGDSCESKDYADLVHDTGQDHVGISTNNLFRFHNNEFDEILCKLDSTEYARSFRKYPTLPNPLTGKEKTHDLRILELDPIDRVPLSP